ncbi:MAG: hypothetical protein KJ607_04555 [Bacteroidetes bacterium]|nr:hypothetical protein [Bacteroidota bacterium]
MVTSELRINFHNLIDKIDNEQLLHKFYELFYRVVNQKEQGLLNNLSDAEKEELYISYAECKQADNLISLEDKEKGIRGFVIIPQVSLFYRVEKHRIILINFFDNRQHPDKRF